MTTTYTKYARQMNAPVPQIKPIPNETQIMNEAGGYVYELDEWRALDRFLILGSAGATYYTNAQSLTKQNAQRIQKLIAKDGLRVVSRVVEISEAGRAPKADPSLFVLALAISEGDTITKRAVVEALPKVARIGTHLFTFVEFADAMRGWGRVLRDAVSNWYTSKDARQLGYQVIKYQQRNGWSHRDLLRLSHAKAEGDVGSVFRYAVKGELPEIEPTMDDPLGQLGLARPFDQLSAAEQAKKATTAKDIVRLIRTFDLPRECVPTHFLKEKAVWEALLEKMPMTAMIRNLATMSRVGILTGTSEASQRIVKELGNVERLKKARIHPIQVLSALRVYSAGGRNRYYSRSKGEPFTPIAQINNALEKAFYASFGNVEPTGKRTFLALDVSSSMGAGEIADVPGLTPREAEAAMVMATVKTEWGTTADNITYPMYQVVTFDTGLTPMALDPTMSLRSVTEKLSKWSGGGTDCAAPIVYAEKNNIPVNAFVVYTDNETWAGRTHPSQALDSYRKKTGIPAKLIVVGFTATESSIARQNDSGMLDIVGFDMAAPNLISSFIRGEI